MTTDPTRRQVLARVARNELDRAVREDRRLSGVELGLVLGCLRAVADLDMEAGVRDLLDCPDAMHWSPA